MDVEAKRRNEVATALDKHFEVWEEVNLYKDGKQLRVDLVASAKDLRFKGKLIGFEVNNPKTALNFAKWAKVFKQAADYVGADVRDRRKVAGSLQAVFVYPSPPYIPHGTSSLSNRISEGDWFRNHELAHYAGVIHLAMHFRVGHASWINWNQGKIFDLSMGPNPIWNQAQGWAGKATDLLDSTRLGSRVITQKD